MTEVENLKAEMKMLEAKNRQLEIENAFIKKLQELKVVVTDRSTARAYLHSH